MSLHIALYLSRSKSYWAHKLHLLIAFYNSIFLCLIESKTFLAANGTSYLLSCSLEMCELACSLCTQYTSWIAFFILALRNIYASLSPLYGSNMSIINTKCQILWRHTSWFKNVRGNKICKILNIIFMHKKCIFLFTPFCKLACGSQLYWLNNYGHLINLKFLRLSASRAQLQFF